MILRHLGSSTSISSTSHTSQHPLHLSYILYIIYIIDIYTTYILYIIYINPIYITYIIKTIFINFINIAYINCIDIIPTQELWYRSVCTWVVTQNLLSDRQGVTWICDLLDLCLASLTLSFGSCLAKILYALLLDTVLQCCKSRLTGVFTVIWIDASPPPTPHPKHHTKSMLRVQCISVQCAKKHER